MALERGASFDTVIARGIAVATIPMARARLSFFGEGLAERTWILYEKRQRLGFAMRMIILVPMVAFSTVACAGGQLDGQQVDTGSEVSTSRPGVTTIVTTSLPPSPVVERVNIDLKWIGSGGGNVFADPPVLSCGSTQGGVQRCTLPLGREVVLTAEALPGSDFLGWGGACATAGTSETCALTLEGQATIEVLFR